MKGSVLWIHWKAFSRFTAYTKQNKVNENLTATEYRVTPATMTAVYAKIPHKPEAWIASFASFTDLW